MGRQYCKLKPSVIRGALERGYYPDGNGLYLRVDRAGAKSWFLRFKRAGKERWMGLGPLRVVPLKDAREAAVAAQRLLLEGKDPIEERERLERERVQAEQRERLAKSQTFQWCAEAYLAAHEAGWSSDKHRGQWRATLEEYAYPVLGDLPVSEIETRHVLQVLSSIWISKNVTARRVRGRIEKILGWASAQGFRSHDNPAKWKSYLDTQLPKPSRIRSVKHHDAIAVEEMPDFMAKLRALDSVSARALEFLALTATRTMEALAAKWEEFDLSHRVWSIPPERTKTRRGHRVPLSERAMAILEEMKGLQEGDYVFPGARRGKPLANMALLQVCHRLNAKTVPHGLRSTFRDWCSTKTNYPREVAERALAHVTKDKAEAAYFRSDLLERRVGLMRDWAEYCHLPPALATVTEIEKRPLRGL